MYKPSTNTIGFTANATNVMTLSSGNANVNGTITATNFVGNGSSLTGLPSGSQWAGTTSLSFTGDIGVNGNVGIGSTVAPSALLTVFNSSSAGQNGNGGILLCGQEFYSANHSSTAGFVFLLNVNRPGNRQLMFTNSDLSMELK